MAIKIGLGKLSLSVPFRQWMDQAIADLGVTVLPISVEHADVQSRLPRHHRKLIRERDGLKAMAHMNSIVNPDEDTFRIYNCEQLFRDV